MDYTAIIISNMLYHAKRSAYRINRLKNRDDKESIYENAQYELTKLYGELRSLTMLSLPKDETKTHRMFNSFYHTVEHFYYNSVLKH